MSSSHLEKMARLAAVASIGLSVVAAGCGKSGSDTQSAAVTQPPRTTPVVLTEAQQLTAGDAICSATIKEAEPLVARLDAISRSGAGGRETAQERGLLIEQIAGATRSNSRMLQGLRPMGEIRNWASALLELAVVEEQLAELTRQDETDQIEPLKKRIEQVRTSTGTQLRALGYRVCGASSRTPVG